MLNNYRTMAARQIGTVCSFVLGYVRYELHEDTTDAIVKVRTMWGTHTLKENRHNSDHGVLGQTIQGSKGKAE